MRAAGRKLTIRMPDNPRLRGASIERLHVDPGSRVTAGMPVLSLTIRNREHLVRAPRPGRVVPLVSPGDTAVSGDPLYILNIDEEALVEANETSRGFAGRRRVTRPMQATPRTQQPVPQEQQPVQHTKTSGRFSQRWGKPILAIALYTVACFVILPILHAFGRDAEPPILAGLVAGSVLFALLVAYLYSPSSGTFSRFTVRLVSLAWLGLSMLAIFGPPEAGRDLTLAEARDRLVSLFSPDEKAASETIESTAVPGAEGEGTGETPRAQTSSGAEVPGAQVPAVVTAPTTSPTISVVPRAETPEVELAPTPGIQTAPQAPTPEAPATADVPGPETPGLELSPALEEAAPPADPIPDTSDQSKVSRPDAKMARWMGTGPVTSTEIVRGVPLGVPAPAFAPPKSVLPDGPEKLPELGVTIRAWARVSPPISASGPLPAPSALAGLPLLGTTAPIVVAGPAPLALPGAVETAPQVLTAYAIAESRPGRAGYHRVDDVATPSPRPGTLPKVGSAEHAPVSTEALAELALAPRGVVDSAPLRPTREAPPLPASDLALRTPAKNGSGPLSTSVASSAPGVESQAGMPLDSASPPPVPGTPRLPFGRVSPAPQSKSWLDGNTLPVARDLSSYLKTPEDEVASLGPVRDGTAIADTSDAPGSDRLPDPLANRAVGPGAGNWMVSQAETLGRPASVPSLPGADLPVDADRLAEELAGEGIADLGRPSLGIVRGAALAALAPTRPAGPEGPAVLSDIVPSLLVDTPGRTRPLATPGRPNDVTGAGALPRIVPPEPAFADRRVVFLYYDDPLVVGHPGKGDQWAPDVPVALADAIRAARVEAVREVVQVSAWCGGAGTPARLNDRIRLLQVHLMVEPAEVAALEAALPIFEEGQAGYFDNRRPLVGGKGDAPVMERAWAYLQLIAGVEPIYFDTHEGIVDVLATRGCTKVAWEGDMPANAIGRQVDAALAR